jgi:putative sterol carrier protein
MSLDSLTDQVRRFAPQLTGLGYKVKFDVADAGAILVDGTTTPPAVGNDDGDADCTISLSAANLEKLLTGQLNPTLAYTLGHIKVDGSLGVAMKLASMMDG